MLSHDIYVHTRLLRPPVRLSPQQFAASVLRERHRHHRASSLQISGRELILWETPHCHRLALPPVLNHLLYSINACTTLQAYKHISAS